MNFSTNICGRRFRRHRVGESYLKYQQCANNDIARLVSLQAAVNVLQDMYYRTHGMFERIQLKKRIHDANQEIKDLEGSIVNKMKEKQIKDTQF